MLKSLIFFEVYYSSLDLYLQHGIHMFEICRKTFNLKGDSKYNCVHGILYKLVIFHVLRT